MFVLDSLLERFGENKDTLPETSKREAIECIHLKFFATMILAVTLDVVRDI